MLNLATPPVVPSLSLVVFLNEVKNLATLKPGSVKRKNISVFALLIASAKVDKTNNLSTELNIDSCSL